MIHIIAREEPVCQDGVAPVVTPTMTAGTVFLKPSGHRFDLVNGEWAERRQEHGSTWDYACYEDLYLYVGEFYVGESRHCRAVAAIRVRRVTHGIQEPLDYAAEKAKQAGRAMGLDEWEKESGREMSVPPQPPLTLRQRHKPVEVTCVHCFAILEPRRQDIVLLDGGERECASAPWMYSIYQRRVKLACPACGKVQLFGHYNFPISWFTPENTIPIDQQTEEDFAL
jgi:hypothetical protein